MADEIKTAAGMAAEVKAPFQTSPDAVKGIADQALGKAKAGEALSSTLREKTDEALTIMNAPGADHVQSDSGGCRSPRQGRDRCQSQSRGGCRRRGLMITPGPDHASGRTACSAGGQGASARRSFR